MTSKISFSFTSEITFITCEWFSGIVYSHMASQAASFCVFLAAHLTDEWSLSCVLSFMNNQLCISYPPPGTPVTFQRALISVGL